MNRVSVRRRLDFSNEEKKQSIQQRQIIELFEKWIQWNERTFGHAGARLRRYMLSDDLKDSYLESAASQVRTFLSAVYESDLELAEKEEALKFAKSLYRQPSFLARPQILTAWFEKNLQSPTGVAYLTFWLWAYMYPSFDEESVEIPEEQKTHVLSFLELLITQRSEFEQKEFLANLSASNNADVRAPILKVMETNIIQKEQGRIAERWAEVSEGKNWPLPLQQFIQNRAAQLAPFQSFLTDYWNWWNAHVLKVIKVDTFLSKLLVGGINFYLGGAPAQEPFRLKQLTSELLDWMKNNVGYFQEEDGERGYSDGSYVAEFFEQVGSKYPEGILQNPLIRDALLSFPVATTSYILDVGNIENGSNWDQQIYQAYVYLDAVQPRKEVLLAVPEDDKKMIQTMLRDVTEDRQTQSFQTFLKSIVNSIAIVPLVNGELPLYWKRTYLQFIFAPLPSHHKRNFDKMWISRVWQPLYDAILTSGSSVSNWMLAILALPESQSRYFVRLFIRSNESSAQAEAFGKLLGQAVVDEKQISTVLIPEASDITGRRWIAATVQTWNSLDTKTSPGILTKALWRDLIRNQIIDPNGPIDHQIDVLLNQLTAWAKQQNDSNILDVLQYQIFCDAYHMQYILGLLCIDLTHILVNGWSPILLDNKNLVLDVRQIMENSGVGYRPQDRPILFGVLGKIFGDALDVMVTPFREEKEALSKSKKAHNQYTESIQTYLMKQPRYIVKQAFEIIHDYLDNLRVQDDAVSTVFQTYVTSCSSTDIAWKNLLGRSRSVVLDVPIDMQILYNIGFANVRLLISAWYDVYLQEFYWLTPQDVPQSMHVQFLRLDPLINCNSADRGIVKPILTLLSERPDQENLAKRKAFQRIQEERKTLEAQRKQAARQEKKEREWKQVEQDEKQCLIDTCAMNAINSNNNEETPCSQSCEQRASIWLLEWLKNQLPRQFELQKDGSASYKGEFKLYTLSLTNGGGGDSAQRRVFFSIRSTIPGWWDIYSAQGARPYHWMTNLSSTMLSQDQLIRDIFTFILPQISQPKIQAEILCSYLEYVRILPKGLFDDISPKPPSSGRSMDAKNLSVNILFPVPNKGISPVIITRITWTQETRFEPALYIDVVYPFIVRRNLVNARIGASLAYDSAVCANDTDFLSQRSPDELLKSSGVTFILLPDLNYNPSGKPVVYCLEAKALIDYWTPEAKTDAPTGNYSWGFCRTNQTDHETQECDAFYQLPTHAGVYYVTPDTRKVILYYLTQYQGGLRIELEPVTSVIQGRKNPPFGHRQSEAPNEWITIYQIRQIA